MKNLIKKNKELLIIIAVGLVGYWQVAFMQSCLKYDILEQYFPWRYFVSDCLRNGIFPQWNPYQHLGYAIHADPQSGVWYPVVWIISLLCGYDAYASQFDFVFHIILAGAGMFLLVKHLVKNSQVALLVACSYMLSGFFVSNAQHLTYIVSGCWIPFILLFYLRLIEQPCRKDVIITALCFFMLVTGGYPAFTIILSYSLLFILLGRIIFLLKKKELILLKKIIVTNFILFLISVILCAGILFSIAVSYNYIAKGQQLPLEIANFNPFSPQSLLSCLLPLVSAKDPVFFDTDISMSNMYFGLICTAAFLFSFFRKKEFKEKVVLAAGIFFLLASFGKYTPVRELLYHFVPLMNLFRFPSIFRFFALTCFLLSAANSLKFIFESQQSQYKKLTSFFLLYFIFYSGIIVLAFTKDSLFTFRDFYFNNFYLFINRLSFWECAMLQSVLMLIILLILFLCRKKIAQKKFHILLWFVIIDMLLAVQLNVPLTVISDYKTADLKKNMEQLLPADFPVPENKSVSNYNDSTGNVQPLWRNKSLLYKRPAFDGYNSFRMKGYEQLSEEKKLLPQLIRNNVAFFSQSFSFYKDTIRDPEVLEKSPNHLFFPEELKDKISFPELHLSTGDTGIFKIFKPDEIKIEYTTTSTQLFTLMQHDYPGWCVFIDGKLTEHYTSDYMFISILIPAGKHLVEFRFENKVVCVGLLLSIVSLLLCLGLLIARRKLLSSQRRF